MSIFDMFINADEISADEAKKMLSGKNSDEVELIDVRQPQEYERGHLPGARLIPLPELASNMNLIDSSKKNIMY